MQKQGYAYDPESPPDHWDASFDLKSVPTVPELDHELFQSVGKVKEALGANPTKLLLGSKCDSPQPISKQQTKGLSVLERVRLKQQERQSQKIAISDRETLKRRALHSRLVQLADILHSSVHCNEPFNDDFLYLDGLCRPNDPLFI